MRDDLDLASIDQTWKRLRAIRVGADALDSSPVVDGIAISCDKDGRWLGLRIDDVFGPWGGIEKVAALCGQCPAIPGNDEPGNPRRIARCHGWLGADGSVPRLQQAVELVWSRCAVEVPLPTAPHWYSIWTGGELAGERLLATANLFRSVEQLTGFDDLRDEACQFAEVLENAGKKKLVVDVELVPPGFSDGLNWTLSACCVQCRATRPNEPSPTSHRCRTCGKLGGVHQERRRKVLGLRPWVSLETVVGPEKAESLLRRSGLLKQTCDEAGP